MTDDEEERRALLAMMYDRDEDGSPTSGAPAPGDTPRSNQNVVLNMFQMSAQFRRLEKMVEDQARQIRRLEGDVRRLTHGLGNVTRTTRTELDNKIDRRDF